MHLSSTVLPNVFNAQKVPPMMLALPGPVQTVVTPPFNAVSNASSQALIPSIPYKSGVSGLVISFVSYPAQPIVD